MNFLKIPFVEGLIKNQISTLAGAAGAYIAAHGDSAGYSTPQIVGAFFCVGAIVLQALENHFGKPAAPAAAVPPPGA